MTTLILAATTGIIILMLAPMIPVRWRYLVTLVLSVPQLYVFPVIDFYLSLGFLSAFLLWPETIKEAQNMLRKKTMLFALALLAIQAISLLWSEDLRLGLRTFAYSLPFFLIAFSTYSIAKKDSRFVYKVLGLTASVVVLEAVLVITFRMSPDLETSYLKSEVAGLLSNPNVISALLDNSERNNVLDPAKAGGVFVNGNVAAGYLGISSFVAFMASQIMRSKSLFFVAAILWASVLFTGSKAGAILMIALPLTGMIFVYLFRYEVKLRILMLAASLVVLLVATVLSVSILDAIIEKFVFAEALVATATIRLLIWAYAAKALFESPILGQGFGGWQTGYAKYALELGIPPTLPPHNTLIYLWSQSGIFAAVFGLVFMFYVINLAYLMAKTNQQEIKIIGVTLGLVAGWLFMHGMVTNWGIFGEIHQQAIFAALLGLSHAALRWCHDSGFTKSEILYQTKTRTKIQ